MNRHARDSYYVAGEGELTFDQNGDPVARPVSANADLRNFRFSRLGPVGDQTDPALNQELAKAMTLPQPDPSQPDSATGGAPGIPAGFTYLAQFVDHDLTLDRTAVALGQDVTVAELVDGRSPALDLDSVYGRGPGNPEDRRFYAADGVRIKIGTTAAVPIDPGTNVNRDGFDLPRVGTGANKAAERAALIPEGRNDENLAVAQTHVAFIHFHNRVVETLAGNGLPGALLFDRARAEVVRHYQWLLRTDFLPRVVDPAIVTDVFTNGRRFFDAADHGTEPPTMPIEFSIAAYRLGHSMVRATYQWNRVFNSSPPPAPGRPPFGIATLFQLFTFTGTSGILTPTRNPADLDDPNAGTFLRLPTNWIVDWRRLHDFTEAGRPDLAPPAETGGGNLTMRIDTLLVNPLAALAEGTFAGRDQHLAQDDIQRNLAYRNLTRANMVRLASGQQMATFLGATPLTAEQILAGDGRGADLSTLDQEQRDALAANTPLWFYILREAELNNGRLGEVGGRIVVEVFHRAMEASNTSIVREPTWRPSHGPDSQTFRMADLLLFAFEGKADNLNPLGDA